MLRVKWCLGGLYFSCIYALCPFLILGYYIYKQWYSESLPYMEVVLHSKSFKAFGQQPNTLGCRIAVQAMTHKPCTSPSCGSECWCIHHLMQQCYCEMLLPLDLYSDSVPCHSQVTECLSCACSTAENVHLPETTMHKCCQSAHCSVMIEQLLKYLRDSSIHDLPSSFC